MKPSKYSQSRFGGAGIFNGIAFMLFFSFDIDEAHTRHVTRAHANLTLTPRLIGESATQGHALEAHRTLS